MTPTYEVLALRYATLQARSRSENFSFPDDHAAPMPLDFFIWVIRGNGRVVVVDTGFGSGDAQSRQRDLILPPDRLLARVDVDAAAVEDVVITHLHWDHAGGIDFFPRATFHVQDAEMAYCTGRCMCHHALRRHFEVEHVVSAVRALYAERMKFHDPVSELAPGITLHEIGGHSAGIQVVRVATERGWVVLASDVAHYWANLRLRNPFPLNVDLPRMMEGFEVVERLADGPDHIIPGHDPLVLRKFPKLNGDADIVRLDQAPID